MVLGNIGPIFVLFRCFFEVFVDCVEFVQRNLFLKFVQIKHPDLYYPLCTLISSVCCLPLSFFVYCVQFAHFKKHSVLLVDFVFLDVVVDFFFEVQSTFFVFSEIVFWIILCEGRTSIHFFLETWHRGLSGKRACFLCVTGLAHRHAALWSCFVLALKFIEEEVRTFLQKLRDCVFLLTFPEGNSCGKLIDIDGLFIWEYLAFEVDDIVLRQVKPAIFAKSYDICSGGAIPIWLPEIEDGNLPRIDEFRYLGHHWVLGHDWTAFGFGEETALLSLLIEEIHPFFYFGSLKYIWLSIYASLHIYRDR